MFLMVTFIATLIHIYSMGYMHDDSRYPRFFAYLSLFCFSMLGLVASANVFMVFIFWELVGVCSYLLIGFWYEEKKNADAANKAFIVNRVGDVGMLVGLGLIWTSFGTFNIDEINRGAPRPTTAASTSSTQAADDYRHGRRAPRPRDGAGDRDEATGRPRQIPLWVLAIAGLGIFAGCVGKSAQFPLHVWLPDAMAGPTPVSALIHAATMVAAGVYLVGRFYPLFTAEVLLYIAYTGGITLFIAASIAIVQTDYKKVLAYSTVSQLGFMMLGLGVGGWAAGLFHLLTHAFFKALLFLGAGSVYHSRPHVRDARARRPAAEDADHGLHDAGRDAGDLGRAVLQRVLLEGRDPRLGALPGAGRALEHFLLFLLPCRRRGDDGLLHVPDVVPRLRRRAAGLPGRCRDGARRTARPSRPRARRAPRGQPVRPRPRERADHDLAADPAGGPDGPRRLDLVGRLCRSASRCWSRCWPTASRSTAIDLGAAHLLRDGGLAPGRDGGHRPGASLYYCPAAAPTSFTPRRFDAAGAGGRAVRRRSTPSSSTSGISTSSTTPSSSGRPWRWPGRLSQFDKWVIDGIVNGSAWVTELLSRLEGALRQDRGRRPGEPDGHGRVRASATGARTSRPAGSAIT